MRSRVPGALSFAWFRAGAAAEQPTRVARGDLDHGRGSRRHRGKGDSRRCPRVMAVVVPSGGRRRAAVKEHFYNASNDLGYPVVVIAFGIGAPPVAADGAGPPLGGMVLDVVFTRAGCGEAVEKLSLQGPRNFVFYKVLAGAAAEQPTRAARGNPARERGSRRHCGRRRPPLPSGTAGVVPSEGRRRAAMREHFYHASGDFGFPVVLIAFGIGAFPVAAGVAGPPPWRYGAGLRLHQRRVRGGLGEAFAAGSPGLCLLQGWGRGGCGAAHASGPGRPGS